MLSNDQAARDPDVQATKLLMHDGTRAELLARAHAMRGCPMSGSRELLAALLAAESLADGDYRVACPPAALRFMRAECPDIARLWPAVFGHIPEPVGQTLGQIARKLVDRKITGITTDETGRVVLMLHTGDELLVSDGGELMLNEHDRTPGVLISFDAWRQR